MAVIPGFFPTGSKSSGLKHGLLNNLNHLLTCGELFSFLCIFLMLEKRRRKRNDHSAVVDSMKRQDRQRCGHRIIFALEADMDVLT